MSVRDGPSRSHDRTFALNGDRRTRILAQLADRADGASTAGRLCEVCKSVTGVSGAGIMLMSGDLPLGSVCTTSDVSALIEDLQYTLGEGPCVDAYQLGRPVLEPDLADPPSPRWPAFTGPAVDAGVRAVFAFPLAVDAVRLGALNLHSDRPGPLSDDQHADALVAADIAAETVLAMQATAPTDGLAAELEEESNFQYVVHQAAGMVSVQLDISVAQALVRLRAYAFSHERLLAEVAAEVVTRRLRLHSGDT
jgi:GAF domain-containing protein